MTSPTGSAIWDNDDLVDQLDEALLDEGNTDRVLSLIPSLFGISDKATYLGWRAIGFTPTEACKVMELNLGHIELWKQTDHQFVIFERFELWRLQREVGPELIRQGVMRNWGMIIAKDNQLIKKALVEGFSSMSKQEYDAYQKAASRYTAKEMLALDQAMNPEKYKENIHIQLHWGDNQQILEEVIDPEIVAIGKVSNGSSS